MARCFICKADTPLGLREPGPRSKVPADRRDKYLPFCAAHEADAIARRDARFGTTGAPPAQPKQQVSGKVSAPAPNPKQGSLFE